MELECRSGTKVRIVSWNVHSFSLGRGSERFATECLKAGASVVCLQEVVQRELSKGFPDENWSTAFSGNLWMGNAIAVPLSFGTVVTSKATMIDCDRSLLSCRIELSGERRALWVACTHLDYQSEARRMKQLMALFKANPFLHSWL